jgi:hypothetical protein
LQVLIVARFFDPSEHGRLLDEEPPPI